MGEAVESSGGHLDKFISDGVMALFGTKTDVGTGARQALAAARGMSNKLAELYEHLKDELDEPLRIGIGIHSGAAIIGEMGYGTATGLTAIGDSVNTASRLESMTKEFGAQLIFF
jgi:adenylate cyclase